MRFPALIITGSLSGVAIIAVVLLGTFYARKALKKMIAEEVQMDSSLEECPQGQNSSHVQDDVEGQEMKETNQDLMCR